MLVLRWISLAVLIAAAPVAAAQGTVPDDRDAAAVFRSLDDVNGPTTRPAKPWLADFTGFASEHPGNWIIGRSHEPCLSEAEAQRAARADATEAAYAFLPQRIRDASDRDELKKSVLSAIAEGGLETDQLVERFDRPYGTVWAESVLLDVSPGKVDSLVAGYERLMLERQRRLSVLRLGASALVAAAWLMYIFLNAVTKGYFTTQLRLGAAAVTAVALVLFF
jgi:hypothetical protein